MSSSSHCAGLQSCLDPALLAEPRVSRLKLAPPKSNSPRSSTPRNPFDTASDCDSKSNNNINIDTGGWSFLQSLTNNPSKSSKDNTDNDKIYTPPSFKRSSSMLNAKSLEICTESLGSETGSDVNESSDEMNLLSLENVNYETREKLSKFKETRSIKRSASFPPPLTSISGSTNVQVRPHREGGRLVLEAVAVSSCRTYFHAERVNGRLRLHLIKGFSQNFEEEKEERKETLANDRNSKAFEGDGVESDEEGEEEYGETEDDDWVEDLEGNSGKVGGEMGMGNLPRPSRCMEGGSGSKALLNWEPFWVAT